MWGTVWGELWGGLRGGAVWGELWGGLCGELRGGSCGGDGRGSCGGTVGGAVGGTTWGELCGVSCVGAHCVYIGSCGGSCVRGAVWRYVAVWGRTVDSPTLGGPLQSVPISPTACSSACAPSSSLSR